MKRQVYFTSIFFMLMLLISMQLSAQVGINIDNSPPDPSAMLDVKSTTKGILAPRVVLSSIILPDPITAPATGLLVYNTANAGTPPNNVIAGYYCWSGTKWIAIASPQGSNAGDMQYWNGTQWVGVPAGSNGQVLTFNNGVPTWGGIQVPIVSTATISNITGNLANSGGFVTSDGGSPVTAKGVCWSINANPTTADSHTTDGNGTGSFTSSITGLAGITLYYVRAYATNSVGTSYGNQFSFTTTAGFYIGQNYGGGIIFYIDGSNLHGLIAASNDQSTGAQWGCLGTFIGVSSIAVGAGQSNTTYIVNQCPTGTAAQICDALVLNGYSDWFLPSLGELDLMYQQRNAIGGFTTNNYWSSSEYSAFNANELYFSSGNQGNGSKSYILNVRAIRSF